MINSIVHVISLKKEAIYLNNKLFLENKNISLSDISNLFYVVSPFNFNKIELNENIKEFPNSLSELIGSDININVDEFAIGDDVSFTIERNNAIYYGVGVIDNEVKDEQGNLIGYRIEEKDSGLDFFVGIKDENETIYFSSDSLKYKASFKLLINTVEQRRKILTPKIGEKVVFKTDKETSEGIVKSIFIHDEYKLKYKCDIEKNNGEIKEVYVNNKRYPMDSIMWRGSSALKDSYIL